MAALYCAGFVLYFAIAFRGRASGPPELAKLLWAVYFALGVAAAFIALTDVLQPVYAPNYGAALFLTLCVVIAISGFLRFRAADAAAAIRSIRGQATIENTLIVLQLGATAFFLPFAASSLVGDIGQNRLELAARMEVLGSWGLLNTLAGAAAQLFGTSLVFAFIRLAQPPHPHRLPRALLLLAASLSYVVYILAYVGRDGVVYWLMTAYALFVVFRRLLTRRVRSLVGGAGLAIAGLLLVPFVAITLGRFLDSDLGSAWSVLEYFGAQIHHFSDYSSIDRPQTFGAAGFPLLGQWACTAAGLECPAWDDLKEFVFGQYLMQDKEPWLFGTYISDFVGDFGYAGTLVLVSLYALLCRRLSDTRRGRRPMTLPRLLLLLFLFLVPYWGIFYFRFSIANGFIVVNLGCIFLIWLLQRRGTRRLRRRDPAPAAGLPDAAQG